MLIADIYAQRYGLTPTRALDELTAWDMAAAAVSDEYGRIRAKAR